MTTTWPVTPPASPTRMRGLLTSIHPALERVLGPRLRHPVVLALLQTFVSPAALAQAGGEEITRTLLEAAPRMRTAQKMTEQVMAALAEQTVTVPGTAAAGDIIPGLAEDFAAILHRRDVLEDRIASLLEAHPLADVLTSMPGVAVRTAARILAAMGDGSASPPHRPPCLLRGPGSPTHRSGTSVRGEGPRRGGNKPLERALFQASFASLSSPDSRAHYDKKRGEGKRHNAALICLTRRKVAVLHSMLKHHVIYEPTHEQAALMAIFENPQPALRGGANLRGQRVRPLRRAECSRGRKTWMRMRCAGRVGRSRRSPGIWAVTARRSAPT
ncbi:transposase [Streptomyces sp. MBT65]|uniref:transposase n=1 Tax=Streptomyces sp. MBT65 TaxID=1488395 RepID=UPI0035B4DF9C